MKLELNGGNEVGFMYGTVREDVHTSIMLSCKGWNSVYCDPPKQQFLGNSATNLNDLFIQGTRWTSGLLESGLTKACPIINCPLRMSLLHRFCHTYITCFPLCCLPFGVLLLSLRTMIIEQRMQMMRSITCHLYGYLDCLMKEFGLRETRFMPTNKVKDEEPEKMPITEVEEMKHVTSSVHFTRWNPGGGSSLSK